MIPRQRMKLVLSARIAEGFLSKEETILELPKLAEIARQADYEALCMRASQLGVHTPAGQIREARRILDDHELGVSMVSGDFNIVYNNDQGPACLRNIGPYIELAESLGAAFIRVAIRTEGDLAAARNAAATAARHGLTLLHQCHVQSRLETVEQIIASLEEIGSDHFGLIFEAANLEECRQSYGPETIRRLAPWIRNVYLQNQRLSPAGAVTLDTWTHGPCSFDVIPITDTGGIDFASVFTGLHQIGYDGPVTVHQSAPSEDPDEIAHTARETACFLIDLWEKTAGK
jgi:sugar phosphate isomerase/epimerase